MEQKPLTPPDRERCQARVPTGGPFVIGGPSGDPRDGYRVRCTNTPVVIATEVAPGEDGRKGSMSLCERCRGEFEKEMKGAYTFERLGDDDDAQVRALKEDCTVTQKQAIDLRFQVAEGAIHVNQVFVGHMTDDSVVLHIDCAQKYPHSFISYDDEEGKLEVSLSVEKEGDFQTLKVDAKPDDNGNFKVTNLTVSGFGGDWHMFEDYGKWGPNIALLRKMPRDESWPAYHDCSSAEDGDTS